MSSIAVLLTTTLLAAPAALPPVEPVSVSGSGAAADGGSYSTSISATGRYVVFESGGANLTPGDTNETWDVFVRDRRTGTTSRMNPAGIGEYDSTHSGSYGGTISADGRYVAFLSRAEVVPGKPSSGVAAFVTDRRTGTILPASLSANGAQPSDDVHHAVISGNGRYVVFATLAGNMVADDDNGLADIFRYDLRTATVQRITVAGPPPGPDGLDLRPLVSADGRFVAWSADAGGTRSVFVHDFAGGTTRRVTTVPGEAGALSADGRFVAFTSDAALSRRDTNGVTDVYVADVRTGAVRLASATGGGAAGDGMSYWWLTISGDGRYVGFGSIAGNLVPGDTNGLLDVFVHDMSTGRNVRVSEKSGGGSANGESLAVLISADGRQAAFTSDATDILPGYTYFGGKVFARAMPR